MRRKKLFMETTQVSPQKSVNEIQDLLVTYGATAILTEYDNGEVIAVSFKHKTGDIEIPYRLPSRWQEVKKLLAKARRSSSNIDAEAKRIAWRQTRRWVEAQLAYVQTNQVKFEQVFLAYMQVGLGSETLYERLEGNRFRMLEHKGGPNAEVS
jgi:hypothetical protein